jgi:mannose-6-phosphate isomerase
MEPYPLKFEPIYHEKIWGGRNLQRLFARDLPPGKDIGESWELADLEEGVSVVGNGPEAGRTLTDLTARWGQALLGPASALDNGRFPLLLKLLDANDILSLQVHPDAEAAKRIGPPAALKTECWYYVESRDGYVYRGVKKGVTCEQFRQAIENNTVEQCVIREEIASGDFHYVPAGTVHALGPGLVVAEVQTPSDTTYRVSDWGRGRPIHVQRSLECIHFQPPPERVPGQSGQMLLQTEYFTVARREAAPDGPTALPAGRCTALMMLTGSGAVVHDGPVQGRVGASAGDTLLIPAATDSARITTGQSCTWLEITLPERR